MRDMGMQRMKPGRSGLNEVSSEAVRGQREAGPRRCLSGMWEEEVGVHVGSHLEQAESWGFFCTRSDGGSVRPTSSSTQRPGVAGTPTRHATLCLHQPSFISQWITIRLFHLFVFIIEILLRKIFFS